MECGTWSWLNLGYMWVPFLQGAGERRVFFFFGFFFPPKAKPSFLPRLWILEGQKERNCITAPGIHPKPHPFCILAPWLCSSLVFQTTVLGRGEVRSASFVHFKTFVSLFMYFLWGSCQLARLPLTPSNWGYWLTCFCCTFIRNITWFTILSTAFSSSFVLSSDCNIFMH